MKPNSDNLSVTIGVGILISVFLGVIGISYSFYKNEIAEPNQQPPNVARNNGQTEESEEEANSFIVSIPRSHQGKIGIDTNSTKGIPTGTYSNPPSTINSGNSFDSSNIDRPVGSFDSSFQGNSLYRESLTNSLPDYSNSDSSFTGVNRDRSRDNSLIRSLDDSDFLENPTSDRNSIEPSYLNDSSSSF